MIIILSVITIVTVKIVVVGKIVSVLRSQTIDFASYGYRIFPSRAATINFALFVHIFHTLHTFNPCDDVEVSVDRSRQGLVGVAGLPRRFTAAALVDYFHAVGQSLRALPVIAISTLSFAAVAILSNLSPCAETTEFISWHVFSLSPLHY